MYIALIGGDFNSATVQVPISSLDFYVYSGDIINVYHRDENSKLGEYVANFLFDANDESFQIPDSAVSIELIWDEDIQEWKQ